MDDIITFLTKQINRNNAQKLTAAATAELLTRAAVQTVEHAAAGNEVGNTLNRQQLGTILVALQWNANPAIRSAVKERKYG